MKKLLFITALMGSLNASCVDVMKPPLQTNCVMVLLEQELGSACGNLPFHSHFNWNNLTEKSVNVSLIKLKNPLVFQMLEMWKDDPTLGDLSTSIIDLLSKDTHLCKFGEKKEHMKELIKNLYNLWMQIPLS